MLPIRHVRWCRRNPRLALVPGIGPLLQSSLERSIYFLFEDPLGPTILRPSGTDVMGKRS